MSNYTFRLVGLRRITKPYISKKTNLEVKQDVVEVCLLSPEVSSDGIDGIGFRPFQVYSKFFHSPRCQTSELFNAFGYDNIEDIWENYGERYVDVFFTPYGDISKVRLADDVNV